MNKISAFLSALIYGASIKPHGSKEKKPNKFGVPKGRTKGKTRKTSKKEIRAKRKRLRKISKASKIRNRKRA